jgi:hypothetical protein
MTRLRRFAPTAPAECPWNGWPNAGGIAGRMLVEQVAEWRGIGTFDEFHVIQLANQAVDAVVVKEDVASAKRLWVSFVAPV